MDDTIRDLKKIPGFSTYLILNNDGNEVSCNLSFYLLLKVL